MRLIKSILFFILLLSAGCTGDGGRRTGAELLDNAEKDYKVGDYIESLKSIEEYIRMTEEGEITATPELETKAYKFLGNIHLIYGDYLNASRHYDRALAASDRLEDKEDKLKLLYNQVIIYIQLEQQQQSEKCIRAIKAVKNVNLHLRDYFYMMALGMKEYKFGNKETAVELMKKALASVDRHGLEPYMKYNPNQFIARSLLEEERYAEALPLLLDFENLIHTVRELPESEIECAQALANVYAQLGNPDMADKYQKRLVHLTDSLSSEMEFQKAKRDMERKAVGYERAESEYVSKTRNTLFGGCCLLIVIGAGGYYGVRRWKKRQTRRLLISRDINSEQLDPDRECRKPDKSGQDNASGMKIAEKAVPVHKELFIKIKDAVENGQMYSNPDLTLETLASALDTNVKYVSSAVSSNTGLNFRSWINSYRIREACRLISVDRATEMSILDICTGVGFTSQSSFISAFRQETGLTPSKYRSQVKSSKAEVVATSVPNE